MADFSFLSDTDDSAVDELISQTQELCVLEQVAAINCSGFIDSVLPAELDSRFRKLKSFPGAESKPKKSSHPPPSSSSDLKSPFDSKKIVKKSGEGENESESESESESEIFSPSKQNPHRESTPKAQNGSDSASSLLNPSDLSPGTVKFSPLKENPDGQKGSKKFLPEQKQRSMSKSKSKSKSGSFSPSSDSSNSWTDSPSPPRRAGCLWWSPKKSSSKKKKKSQNRVLGSDMDLDWGSNDEFLSDLSVFSAKERQKILKNAMKEEEKINREAEKIVKWAKQASARMSASGIGDKLSDDDDYKVTK